MHKKKIAIFQYEWPLNSFTRNMVVSLANYGFTVDLFYFNHDHNPLVSWEEMKADKNVKIYDYGNYPENSIVFKLLEKCISRFRHGSPNINIRDDIYDHSLQTARREQYDVLIGVEKLGLIWAGMIGDIIGKPYIYYNLELYIEDHPWFSTCQWIRASRPREIEYHQKSIATIISDRFRKDVLFKYNKIKEQEVIYLPIGVRSYDKLCNSQMNLREKFAVGIKQILVLYFGHIIPSRLCLEVAKAVSSHKDCVFVLHGFGDRRYLNKIKEIERVFISSEMIEEESIQGLISQADIGIAIYRNDFSNDRLTAFSSDKIAQYMKSMVPIIAYKNETFEALRSEFLCVEMIDDLMDIPTAINTIISNRTIYKEECSKAYSKYYHYDNTCTTLSKYIEKMG